MKNRLAPQRVHFQSPAPADVQEFWRTVLGIAEVAHRWGFTHLGRFAAEYAERYGRPPSRTKSTARPTGAPARPDLGARDTTVVAPARTPS